LKAREVAITANSNGWKHVEEFIKSNIFPLENSLFTDTLEKEEFQVIQAKRQAYQSVLDFVNRRVKEAIKDNQGG
jgi:hypothetical protein